MSRRLLVDAHAHLHDGVRPSDLLDAAARNVARAAGLLGLGRQTVGVLCLADLPGQDAFARLGAAAGRWTVEPGGEPETRIARRDDGRLLALVAGCQRRTDDGLEVLTLATLERPADGGALPALLERCLGTGGIVVLPWGVGKWWLGRGRAVRSALGRHGPATVAVGDNGGRPPLGEPAIVRAERRRGRRVLSGSDPLPIEGDVERTGSFGVVVAAGHDDVGRTASLLRDRVADPAWQPDGYGRTVGLAAFVRQRLALRRVRAAPRSAGS